MAESNPVDILLKFDLWATRQMIRACEPLSAEQFHRRFEIGRGSLHDVLVHVISAMGFWGDLLAGRQPVPRPDESNEKFLPAQLIDMLQATHRNFEQSVRAKPFDGTVQRERGGKIYTFTRGSVFCQVMTHGMHHRAQVLNMLRHSGVNPLPTSSVTEWARDGEPR